MHKHELPFVSVIMPIRNEQEYIRRSLYAVLTQDYPEDKLEVIVADGFSADSTREIVESFQKRYSNLRLIDNDGKIVSTGLNAAIRHARGEIILRVDGHCEIISKYVLCCVEHLYNENVDVVGGVLETVGETNIAETISLAMSSPFGVGDVAFRTGSKEAGYVDTVAFGAYKRGLIERAGPLDEELVRNQDDEYNYRLRKLGARILLTPEIKARYYSRSSIGKLWHQYFQYGYWKVRVLQKHPRQMRSRQFVPPLFVSMVLISIIAAAFTPLGKFFLVAIGSAYTCANLFASICTAMKAGWRHLVRLPLIFAALHFSYGLGFLIGLIKFGNRWLTPSPIPQNT